MIRFESVTKTYLPDARPALDDVTVDIDRGEFVFLVGASGSGKTTFMRMILREVLPTTGSVYVGGRDVTRIASWRVPKYRRGIGMVFQDFRLLPNRTAAENVAFALEVTGARRRDVRSRVPELLELVGLADEADRLPHELSGGEQQRVAIARATANEPGILMADEPTGNLDPATSHDIMDLLQRINDDGTTIIMATHDYELVDSARRRVLELAGGVVVRDDAEGGYSGDLPESEIYDPSRSARPERARAGKEGVR